MLSGAGLGEERLLAELEARLRSNVTKFYQERNLGNFEDNTTRMRATELLADLHGKKKQNAVEHQVETQINITVNQITSEVLVFLQGYPEVYQAYKAELFAKYGNGSKIGGTNGDGDRD